MRFNALLVICMTLAVLPGTAAGPAMIDDEPSDRDTMTFQDGLLALSARYEGDFEDAPGHFRGYAWTPSGFEPAGSTLGWGAVADVASGDGHFAYRERSTKYDNVYTLHLKDKDSGGGPVTDPEPMGPIRINDGYLTWASGDMYHRLDMATEYQESFPRPEWACSDRFLAYQDHLVVQADCEDQAGLYIWDPGSDATTMITQAQVIDFTIQEDFIAWMQYPGPNESGTSAYIYHAETNQVALLMAGALRACCIELDGTIAAWSDWGRAEESDPRDPWYLHVIMDMRSGRLEDVEADNPYPALDGGLHVYNDRERRLVYDTVPAHQDAESPGDLSGLDWEEGTTAIPSVGTALLVLVLGLLVAVHRHGGFKGKGEKEKDG